jgi:hypothetical protein
VFAQSAGMRRRRQVPLKPQSATRCASAAERSGCAVPVLDCTASKQASKNCVYTAPWQSASKRKMRGPTQKTGEHPDGHGFCLASLGHPGRAQGTTIDCESIALTQSVEQISSCSRADAARLHSARLPFCSSASLVPRSETRACCATTST